MPQGGIPEDYRILLGLDRLAHHLEIYEQSLGKLRRAPAIPPATLREIVGSEAEAEEVEARLTGIAQAGPRLDHKPKPDAYEKRMAAEAGLRLCERFDVRPTTTKRSTFWRLAAVLYGDESADLQHHCREVLKRFKTKT
jgi:hypothetical protein